MGRGGECAVLAQALDVVQSGEAVWVWVEGEPGSGKTALAEWARSHVDHFRCVLAGCVDSESGLSLATALTVVRGLRQFVDDAAPAYRAPLRGLLGLGSGINDDPFLLGAALLDLIATAAAERPVLIVLDDWHWIDAASAAVLEFAFRRLENDAVGVLVTSRLPPARPLPRSRDQEIRLVGLGVEEGVELLARDGPISLEVAREIVAATAGLPLALREVGAELSADQRIGATPLPSPLPVGDRLLADYRARLSRLPSDVRTAIGVAAVAGSDPAGVSPAMLFLNLDIGLLEAAEAAGVISGGPLGSPVFAHPLMRAAALGQLSGSERRRVEWAFASVVDDPERRSVHLIGSTQGPSARISALLEAAAQEVERRRGPLAAAGIWADAARVTPAGPVRIARVLKAGEFLTAVGRLAEAHRCLTELLGSTDDPLARAEAVVLMSWGRLWNEPAEAARDALAEADRVGGVAPAHAAQLRSVAALGHIVSADIRAAQTAIAALDSEFEADALPTLEVVAPLDVLANLGNVPEANRQLSGERVRRWIQVARKGPAQLGVIMGLQLTAIALTSLERFDEAERLVLAASSSSRRSGRPQGVPFLLGVDSLLAWWRGDWDRMNAVLIEMLTLAGDTGESALAESAAALLGRLAAARGDAEHVATYLSEPPAPMDRRRGVAIAYRMSALGLWHLGDDRPVEAASVLGELDRLCTESGIGNAVVVPYAGDYIAALHGSGNHERAELVVDRTLGEAERTGLAWTHSIGLRGQAMVTSGPDADRAFAAALDAWPDGFDGARTRLAWGEALLARDEQQRGYELLNLATEEFSRLGARPWLQRALALLGTPPRPTIEVDDRRGLFSVLTAQELKVSLKVAEGCTNREAAAQLFISAKTVEHHLSAAYTKLGIRSRSELARLAAEMDRSRTARMGRTAVR